MLMFMKLYVTLLVNVIFKFGGHGQTTFPLPTCVESSLDFC